MVGAGFELIPKPPGSKSNSLNYRPAQSTYAGVILGYRWLAGTISFAIPAAREVRDIEGTSRYRDYRLTYYVRRFGLEASYSRYLGYLIDNSSELPPEALGGQTFYKLPDVETIGYGANLLFVSDPERYSLPAALDQSELQKKSGGSTLFLLTWRHQILQSWNPVIPVEKRGDFGGDATIRSAHTGTYAGGFGYGYMWVPGSFFVSGLGALSLGYQRVRYELDTGPSSYSSLGANIHMRLALGTNSRRFFLTGAFYLDRFGQNAETIEIGNNVIGLNLSVGVRF